MIEFVPLAMTSSHPPDLAESRSQPVLADDNSLAQHDENGSDGKPVRLSGSLFFALPNGGAVLYQLEGFSEGPEAASTTGLETPAKTALAFTVPVTNWLRRPQRCQSVVDSHAFVFGRAFAAIRLDLGEIHKRRLPHARYIHAQMPLYAVVVPY